MTDLDMEARWRQWPAHKGEHDTPVAGCCWCDDEREREAIARWNEGPKGGGDATHD